MIAHAMIHAARGWRVFPLVPRDKVPAICGGKGCLDATTDLGQIGRWWQGRFAGRNIGIATGRASGIVVGDVDARSGGFDTMRRLVAEHGPIPPTLRAKTAGGVHLYFAAPATPIRSAAHVLGAGVDTRGEGGYVVGPPSVHPSGARYHWITQHAPAVMPAWMLALTERSAPTRDPFKGARLEVPVDAERRALAWLARCEPAIQGSDGSGATMHAAHGLIVGFRISDREAFYMLKEHFNPRCQPPWSDDELSHKVASVTPQRPLGYLLNVPRRAA